MLSFLLLCTYIVLQYLLGALDTETKKKNTVVRQFGTVVRQSRAHISALPLAINLGKLLDLFIHIENKRKKVQKFSLFPSNALYALPYVLRNT